MSFKMRKLLEDNEDKMVQRFLHDPAFRQATRLRQGLVRRVLRADPRFHKTQEEIDWLYIVKREYNYVVLGRAGVWSFLPAAVANAALVFALKRLTVYPLFVLPVAFVGFYQYFFLKHAKRLFDMCNIGEEFELGQERNRVLRQCNDILGVEDF